VELIQLSGCDDGNCPRVVTVKGQPRMFVQGAKLTSAERAALGIPDGEDAVALPSPDIILEAARRLEAM
jgi:hypothetical protein